jgi:hypothetical protein
MYNMLGNDRVSAFLDADVKRLKEQIASIEGGGQGGEDIKPSSCPV